MLAVAASAGAVDGDRPGRRKLVPIHPFSTEEKPSSSEPAAPQAGTASQPAVVGVDVKPPPIRGGGGKQPAKPKTPEELAKAGYKEITRTEALWLLEVTRCNEAQLAENSTYTVVREAGRKESYRYFLHASDPLLAPVVSRRQGRKSVRGANFFGTDRKGVYCR